MSVDGNWNVTMSTPLGERQATLELKSSGTTLTFLLVTPTIAAPPASAEDRVFPKPR